MIKTVDFNGQQVVSGTQTLKAVNEGRGSKIAR